MPHVSEILDYHGFRAEDFDRKVDAIPNEKLGEIAESIRQAINYDSNTRDPRILDHLDPFRFLAGSSVRGDAGCSRPECRLVKINSFVRFAALYCDEVFVPLHITIGHGHEADRIHLRNSIQLLCAARPLIDADIVRPIIPNICRTCLETSPEIMAVRVAANAMAEQHLDKFRMFGLGLLGDTAVVSLEGPPDFLEHGQIVSFFKEVPDWFPENCRRAMQSMDGVSIQSSVIESSRMVHKLFQAMAMDVIAQMICSRRVNCGLNYLMGRQGEIDFVSTTKQARENSIRAAAVAEKLSHEVPILAEAPIDSVVELRTQNRDAFVMYRDTIKRLINEHLMNGRGLSVEEARLLYGDVLAPRLSKLKAEAEAYKHTLRSRALLKAGASVAILSFGVLSGVLPSGIAEVIKIVGGFGLVKEIFESAVTAGEDSEAVRSDDLYFLLRLAQND